MKTQWVAVGLLVVGLVVFGFASSDCTAMEAKAIESPRQPDQLILQKHDEDTELRDMVPILA